VALPRAGRRTVSPRHLLRYGLATLIAGEIAEAVHWGHVYWAMVAAVVPMAAPTFYGRLARGIQRIIGTFAGVGVAYLLLQPDLPAFWLIVLIVVLQGGAELLIGRNYGLTMLLVTPLALLVGEIAHQTSASSLIRDRLYETALGAAVALALTVVLRDARDT